MTLTVSQQAATAIQRVSRLAWLNAAPPAGADGAPPPRYTLLLFFRPNSVPCLHALRTLERLAPGYGPQVQVVGVFCPQFARERDPHSARTAVERLDLHLPVVHDAQRGVSQAYGVHTLPTFLLIEPGEQVLRHEGEADPRKLKAVLDRIVARESAEGHAGEPVQVLGPTSPREAPAAAPTGLRFPTVVKPFPGAQQRWVVADCGRHQIVLLDDRGTERARFGTGLPGFGDGPASRASFRHPRGLVCSADAIYVADTGNHAIRRIDVIEQRVTTVAGTGARGYRLPPTPRDALSHGLCSPWDLELDGSEIYFSNPGTRQIGIYDRQERTVVRAAGSGEAGEADGPAHLGSMTFPANLVLEESGELLFFSDAQAGQIRALRRERTPLLTTTVSAPSSFAAASAVRSALRLQLPLGIAWAAGDLLVADCYNDRVLNVPLGEQGVDGFGASFPQGEGDVPALPRLSEPMGVWADDADRLLIVDTNNHRIVHWSRHAPAPAWETWPRPSPPDGD